MTPEQAWEADIRYQEYRNECYAKTLENLVLLVGPHLAPGVIRTISLGPIHKLDAVEAVRLWDGHRFDWPLLVDDFQPYINRFEAALRVGGKLCALAFGRPSAGPDNVTIHFMERKRDDNPLAGSVALLITDAADNYARVLGRSRVKIKNQDPAAIRKYELIGFLLAEQSGSNTYYARKVE